MYEASKVINTFRQKKHIRENEKFSHVYHNKTFTQVRLNVFSKTVFTTNAYYIRSNGDFARIQNTKKMKLAFNEKVVDAYIYCSDANRLVIAILHPEKTVHDLLFLYNRRESLRIRLSHYKTKKRKYTNPACNIPYCCPRF